MKKFAKNDKRGFTLAELLIVVAIIAVLVAISIPIFSSQLEKSRDAVSVANIRAAYAEAATAALTQQSGGNATYTAATGSAVVDTVVVEDVALKGTQNGWSGLDAELPFTHTALTEAMGAYHSDKKYKVTFTFGTADGACTLTAVEEQTTE